MKIVSGTKISKAIRTDLYVYLYAFFAETSFWGFMRSNGATVQHNAGCALCGTSGRGKGMTGRKKLPETKLIKQAEIIPRLKSWLCSSLLLCLLLPFSPSLAFASDYLLYLPSEADTSAAPRPGNGVLVKRIIIKKGDTLSALSQQFSGKGTFFPQILLFNEIHNPNLIYAGKELLVPLSAAHSLSTVRRPTSVVPVVPRHRSTTFHPKRDSFTNSGKDSVMSAERHLYEQSAALFTEGKYHEALDGFSRFLKQYPSSPLAPDASLFRGDCYLRLSEI